MGVSQKGLHDWIIQRLSALVMVFYIAFMVGYFFTHPVIQFEDWQDLFSAEWMQISTMIVLLGLMWHAWIGIWTIFTDYIKCPIARITLEVLVLLALVAYFFWGFSILWSI